LIWTLRFKLNNGKGKWIRKGCGTGRTSLLDEYDFLTEFKYKTQNQISKANGLGLLRRWRLTRRLAAQRALRWSIRPSDFTKQKNKQIQIDQILLNEFVMIFENLQKNIHW